MKVFFRKIMSLAAILVFGITPIIFTYTAIEVPKVAAVIEAVEKTDYIMLAPVPGIVKGDCDFSDPKSNCTTDVSTFVKGIFQFFIGAAGALAVLLIMWEGFQYVLTAKEQNKTKSKARIQEILTGLLIAVSSVLILNFIDPTFTQFKFRFPEKPAVQNDVELNAFYNNLMNRAAEAQAETATQVANYNQQLATRRNDLNTLISNRDAATTPEERARYDAAITDTRKQIAISEDLDRRSLEIKQLAERGSISAAEDKLREMSLYFDQQARSWQTNAPGTAEEKAEIQRQQQAEIRKEGATRQREMFLYVSQVRLKQESGRR